MVLLGIVLRFVQENRADHAAEKLQAMVSTTATVLRDGKRTEIMLQEIRAGRYALSLSRGHGTGRCAYPFCQGPLH